MVDDEENLSALDAAHAGSDGDDEGCDETRGKILQRHKREWKSLRSKLNDLKAHKKAMGHGTLAKKDAKKDVAKEIKSMEEVMRSDPASPVPANACVPNLASSHYTPLHLDLTQPRICFCNARIRHDKELADFDSKHQDTLPPNAYCEHNRERSMCKACQKTSIKSPSFR